MYSLRLCNKKSTMGSGASSSQVIPARLAAKSMPPPLEDRIETRSGPTKDESDLEKLPSGYVKIHSGKCMTVLILFLWG